MINADVPATQVQQLFKMLPLALYILSFFILLKLVACF